MKSLKSILVFAVGLLAVAASTLVAQITAAPSLLVTLTGTPTLSPSAPDPKGAVTFVGTFNATLMAQNGNVDIGLPGSTLPGVPNSPEGITFLKNGVSDPLTGYSVSVSYSAPTGTVTVNNQFTIMKNAQVTVPITIAVIVPNPGANKYAIKLNSIFWTNPTSGKDVVRLGSDWTAGATPVVPPPSPTPTIPSELQDLTSLEDLWGKLIREAREVDVTLSQGDNYQTTPVQLTGAATIERVISTLKAQAITFKTVTPTSPLGCQITVRTADYSVATNGFDQQTPSIGKGGGYGATFKITSMYFGSILVKEPNVRGAKFTPTGYDGKPNGPTVNLDINPGVGFWFESRMAGSGILELVLNDGTPQGKTITVDLRNRAVLTNEIVSVTMELAYGPNAPFFKDVSDVVVAPYSVGGVGDNVLATLVLSRATTVNFAAQTTEGGRATAFKVTSLADGKSSMLFATNGVASGAALGTGEYLVTPQWSPKDLRPPLYYSSGKGSIEPGAQPSSQ